MNNLPSGTVTFLFTDIEGSTRLWQEQPESMKPMRGMTRFCEARSKPITAMIFQIVGDSLSAAFHNAVDGLRAVLSAQRGLHSTSGLLGDLEGAMNLRPHGTAHWFRSNITRRKVWKAMPRLHPRNV